MKITIEIPNERGGECENTSGEIENFDSFELFKLKKLTEFLYEFPSVDAINEDGDLVQLICNELIFAVDRLQLTEYWESWLSAFHEESE